MSTQRPPENSNIAPGEKPRPGDEREADKLAGVALGVRRLIQFEPQRGGGKHRGDQDVAEAKVGHEAAHPSCQGWRNVSGERKGLLLPYHFYL